ncbi:MAG: hypothetical protein ACTHLU_05440 [Novosphingobium sp.]
MTLPKFDVAALPDFGILTGVLESLLHPIQAASSDDTIIILMVFLYEIMPPGGHF